MNAIDTALFNLFTADNGGSGIATLATDGFHLIQAPQGTTGLFFTYADISGVPSAYTLVAEASRRFIYRFQVFDEGEDTANVEAIANRLEFLLVGKPLTLTGWVCDKPRLKSRNTTFQNGEGTITYPACFLDFIIEAQKQ
jgi:hypothetical protein